MTPALASAVSDKTKLAFGTDQDARPDCDLIPVAWTPPDTITPEVQREARELLEQHERASQPADMAAVRIWLAGLGMLTAGKMTAEDAKSKILAYAGTMKYPAGVFTQDSLDRAGRNFKKWFPTYGEVCEFLDREKSAIGVKAGRLRIIAAGGRKPAGVGAVQGRESPRQKPTEDDKARVAELMVKVRANLAGASLDGAA